CLFEPLPDINVLNFAALFELFNLRRDPLVQVADGDTELLTPRIVVERYGCAILHGTLKAIARDVVAEDTPSDFIALKEGSSSEADIGSIRQCIAHVECKLAVLRPMRL